VLFPAVTRYSLSGAPERYAVLARTIGAAATNDSDQVAGERLVEALAALNGDLGITRLRELGVERERLDAVKEPMAQAALDSGSPGFNPRVPSLAEIVELYEEVW
jgi:alcohol dehydrogenase class IV